MRYRLLEKIVFLLLTVTGSAHASAAESTPTRADVLLILIDDHAANTTSAQNESPIAPPRGARGPRLVVHYAYTDDVNS